MKILYVEDNEDNIYMLKNRLSRAGFTVIVATDGTQGVTMATSEQPDLILMDLTLPDINGEEATRRLKADPATKSIPVIALTANAIGAGDNTVYGTAATLNAGDSLTGGPGTNVLELIGSGTFDISQLASFTGTRVTATRP
jgi:CheY-like chemotaxis protein